jgi:hypothetical protein
MGDPGEVAGWLEEIRAHQRLAGRIVPGRHRGKAPQPWCCRSHEVREQAVNVAVERVVLLWRAVPETGICLEEST